MIKDKITILGLGYVGLPLAVEFSNKFNVVGFDISKKRIKELNSSIDKTDEIDEIKLKRALDKNLFLSNNLKDIKDSNIYIVTVPTPITKFKKPDLSYLKEASKMVGQNLSKGDLVIYESTVYPGCTEEECVPVLEDASGLKFNLDFFCGYSPERINPGDKINTLVKIKKVTSGSTIKIAEKVDKLYGSIIEAGTHRASSIKVAEASKAIENAQRDLNISFVNELALIFDKIGIDTSEVLEAAATKWNFLSFKPGLVGGHCISVDPYYLTYKAETLGYSPEVILSGRRVNDNMGIFVANKAARLMRQKGISTKGARSLILGITFKENCPDIRNSKVPDICEELEIFGMKVSVFDPYASMTEVEKEFGIKLISELIDYDLIILAVAHDKFLNINIDRLKKRDGAVVFDLKSFLDKKKVDARL
jgi:UDP-N-acetyl-D-galactosamine dehydrogenase|tara:strand:- start:1451 stop:2713 length:1263 start_codon:yes stop_codon:yes gene_type:complete